MNDDVKKPPYWSIREIPIKDIKENPKNPRYIKKDMLDHLDRNISTYGLVDRPIINQNMVLIGGHQRVRLLKRKKHKTVECMVPDRLLSDFEADDLLIGLNLHKGDWDYEHMANHWDVIDLLNKGFSEQQLLDQAKKAEEVLSEGKEEKAAAKKKKTCPNCGCEF